jgi:hypothetical protein
MGKRVWYEALALMADGTSHHHVFHVASSEEAEQRIRNHYPDAATILVRQGYPWTNKKESRMRLWEPTLLLNVFFTLHSLEAIL